MSWYATPPTGEATIRQQKQMTLGLGPILQITSQTILESKPKNSRDRKQTKHII